MHHLKAMTEHFSPIFLNFPICNGAANQKETPFNEPTTHRTAPRPFKRPGVATASDRWKAVPPGPEAIRFTVNMCKKLWFGHLKDVFVLVFLFGRKHTHTHSTRGLGQVDGYS